MFIISSIRVRTYLPYPFCTPPSFLPSKAADEKLDVQKVRARAVGAEHEQMLMRSDGYMTAWMLYQLAGDEEAAAVFVGENAEILHNNNWQDVEKNQ